LTTLDDARTRIEFKNLKTTRSLPTTSMIFSNNNIVVNGISIYFVLLLVATVFMKFFGFKRGCVATIFVSFVFYCPQILN
jgi:hypothetical protein